MEKSIVQKFSEINLNDSFFDSLKADYVEFSDWFDRKAENKALVPIVIKEYVAVLNLSKVRMTQALYFQIHNT
ncbi:hypothetical protein O9992_31010 [Vibrio lentus]|nr:hypothetical protein [Vibrio lentus]